MVSAAGYTLSAETSTLPAGQATTLRLRILGPDGQPVLRYGLADGRLIQLTLVRRDLVGDDEPLIFTIREEGQPVTDLDRYLGGSAHLAVLRVGDLAYVPTRADPEDIALFLDFATGGTVHTAAFTLTTPQPLFHPRESNG